MDSVRDGHGENEVRRSPEQQPAEQKEKEMDIGSIEPLRAEVMPPPMHPTTHSPVVSSSQESALSISCSQDGSGDDMKKKHKLLGLPFESFADDGEEGRLENVQKKRKVVVVKMPAEGEEEKLPEFSEGEEDVSEYEEEDEEEENRKAKAWKEWDDRKRKEYEEIDFDNPEWFMELMKLMNDDTHTEEHLKEYFDSIPPRPRDMKRIQGLDPEMKRFLGIHDVDPVLWERYLQERDESEGFDVFTDPGDTPRLKVIGVQHDVDPEFHQQVKDWTEEGLKSIAKEHPGYKFKEIMWVTGYCSGDGWAYNVTFLALGADGDEARFGRVFQARVFFGGVSEDKLLFCRPKVFKTYSTAA